MSDGDARGALRAAAGAEQALRHHLLLVDRPPAAVKRHHVHALYGFCRYADDIVDDLGPGAESRQSRGEVALASFGDRFFADLASGTSDDPVLKAVVHTVRAFAIDPDCFRRFLRSMAMDLTVATYETFDDLLDYMDGSAAVIGEMMLPILEPLSPEALEPAAALGDAFQLTNFLRDVAEDLDRGRTYVPQEDIRRFGAESAFAERRATPAFVELLRFEIERTLGAVPRSEATAGFGPAATVGPCICAPRAALRPGSSTSSRPTATTCSRHGRGSRRGRRP